MATAPALRWAGNGPLTPSRSAMTGAPQAWCDVLTEWNGSRRLIGVSSIRVRVAGTSGSALHPVALERRGGNPVTWVATQAGICHDGRHIALGSGCLSFVAHHFQNGQSYDVQHAT